MADPKVSAPAPATPADTAAAEKAKASATEAATSVADAVKRVADAAVAEVQKHPVATETDSEFTFIGSTGGRFRIRGAGLGTNGTVTLNGVPLKTTGWGSTNIEGTLPADARPGVVLVHVDPTTVRKGYYRG